MRSRVALAGIVVCLVTGSVGQAAGQRATKFEVTRLRDAESCPDAAGLSGAVTRLAGAAPDAAPDPRPPVAFDVTFARNGEKYVAGVRADALGATRDLVSKGPSCAPLAEAVTVAIAVLLDRVHDDAPGDDAATAARPIPAVPEASSLPPIPPMGPAPASDVDDSPPPRKAWNVVFGEMLGSGVAYSVNYERFLWDDMSVRVGIGLVTARDSTWSFTPAGPLPVVKTEAQLSLPLLLNYYSAFGRSNHTIHYAAGATVLYRSGSIPVDWYNPTNSLYLGPSVGLEVLVDFIVGYRYVARETGLMCGVDLGFLLNFATGLLPWGGVDAGVVF